MRSYPLAEARAEFSKLVDRALAGEPQRVTRRGREAVVIVSEAEWRGQRGDRRAAGAEPRIETFADALIALGRVEGLADILDDVRASMTATRPLGSDFVADE